MATDDPLWKKVWNTEFSDLGQRSAGSLISCGCCCIVNFILIILFFPCTVSQLGQFKLGLVRNKVTGYVDIGTPHEPGRYWIGFWKEFVEFPSTLNTIEFSEERTQEQGVHHLGVLRSRDKDGKLIFLDISVQYRLHPKDIGEIYVDMLTFYEDIFISELRDAFAKAANLFAIADAWQDYTSVVDIFSHRCKEVLEKRHAECWGLQLWGITLTPQYEDKLVQTQVRKQAQMTEVARKDKAEIRAVTEVLLAEYGKNITIVRSGGLAKQYIITRDAVATAQANLVGAQADSLQIVKDKVCPSYSKASNGNCSQQNWVMNGPQLVYYHKMALLKAMNASHLIYNMRGGAMPETYNVEATRNIMHGRVRRRLLDNRGEHDDANKPVETAADGLHVAAPLVQSGPKSASKEAGSEGAAHVAAQGAHEL